MNFLFDNNLPPDLAHAVRELCASEQDVTNVYHLSDLFKPSTPDVEWIEGVGKNWYVVSIDKFTKSRGTEREALRRAGHTVYILDPQWSSHPFWLKSSRLILWWPQVLEHARLIQGGIHRIPWRHTSGKRFVSL